MKFGCFRNWAHDYSLINEKIQPSVRKIVEVEKGNDCILIDTLTVNETASEPPPEDGTMDSAKNLGMEAVFINHNFPQQVLKMVLK